MKLLHGGFLRAGWRRSSSSRRYGAYTVAIRLAVLGAADRTMTQPNWCTGNGLQSGVDHRHGLLAARRFCAACRFIVSIAITEGLRSGDLSEYKQVMMR